MKRGLKILFIIVGIVVILGIIFFAVDYNRVQKQEKPIFCIQNPAGVIRDGGTIEYFGLGYKVIDFHTLAGFDDIKIGTWLMDYNDFEKEMKEYEKKFEEELQKDNRNQESNINNKVTTIDIQTTGLSSETSIKKYTLNQEEIYEIFNIIDNLTFSNETCDGLPTYYIKYNSEEENSFVTYGIEIFDDEYHVTSASNGEAILSNEQKEQLDEIIDKIGD
ncbi:MAG: hypothetical protein K8V75_03545 [Methanobrevibacter woesei]|nr:hypothetical protein [Methanobrevibacter woesei]